MDWHFWLTAAYFTGWLVAACLLGFVTGAYVVARDQWLAQQIKEMTDKDADAV